MGGQGLGAGDRTGAGVFRAPRKAWVEVIFITGRKESDRPGTEKNLRAAGFSDYAAPLLKPNGTTIPTQKFKSETRHRFRSEGRVVIANVGDQENDLAGGLSERMFKMPGLSSRTK